MRAHAEPNAACMSVLGAFVSNGTPFVADYNAGIEQGIGLTRGNIDRGLRISAAKAYLTPLQHEPSLTIATDVRVLRLAMEGTRCSGVVIDDGGRERIIRAARETMLRAGAIVSPKLLMLFSMRSNSDSRPRRWALS